jgi:glycosyltransferase involved in cell wall biosynthesis
MHLCDAELKAGADVTLAALAGSGRIDLPSFVKTFALGVGPPRLGCSPKMREWLKAQAIDAQVDIIHNHSSWMMPNVYPGKICKTNNIPLIFSPRGTLSSWAMKSGSLVKKVFWPLIQKPVLEMASCFHATAISEYEDIRRLGFRQPVAIIPNGIDLPIIKSAKIESIRTVLFLGRIHPVKGLDMLLPAWKILQSRFKGWQLKIVGPDNRGYLAKMQMLAKDLSLERIEFCGPLYGDKKFQAYADADLFVLPTYSENFGMAIAEALAVGTPAIVTKGAPWPNLNLNQAGWWIDINIEALVTALEVAMSMEAQELSRMGLNGKQWMATEYSWPEIGNQMLRTYDWVLHGGKVPEWVLVD